MSRRSGLPARAAEQAGPRACYGAGGGPGTPLAGYLVAGGLSNPRGLCALNGGGVAFFVLLSVLYQSARTLTRVGIPNCSSF